MSSAEAPRKGAREPSRWLGATLLYVLLTLLYTYPAVLQLTTHMLGGPYDGPMFLWNTWWGAYSVFELGSNPLWTDYLFYPHGTSLAANTHNVLHAVLSAPLQAVAGLLPAYDISILLTYVLSGTAAYLLVYECTGDRRAAFVAGSIFAFGPIRSSFIVFFNLIQSQLLVFFAWSLLRAWKRESTTFAAVAGVFAAALFYTSYNLLVLAFLFGLCFAAFALFAGRRDAPALVACARQWGALAVVAAVLSAPIAAALYATAGEDAGEFIDRSGSRVYRHSVPVTRYVTRTPLEGKQGDLRLPIHEASYLGAVAMALVLAAVVTRRRDPLVRFWLWLAIGFLLVSLGPRLNWSGASLPSGGESGLPMPFAAIRDLPLLGQIRSAHRYALLAWMALSVLAGFGAASLFSRWDSRPRYFSSSLLAVAVVSAVMLDFLDVPFVKQYRLPEPPAVIAEIAQDDRAVSVLHFPSGRAGYAPYSYYQTLHRKPAYRRGEMARVPPDVQRFRSSSPLYSGIQRMAEEGPQQLGTTAEEERRLREEVAENRVGWILIAWANKNHMRARGEGTYPESHLVGLDQWIVSAFPNAELRYRAGDGAPAAWSALETDEAISQPAIWAAYRLPLDD